MAVIPIYVNDIVNVSPSLIPILFADDINIFLEGTDINEVIVRMNAELIKVMDWINANKLSLNIEKTKCMVFHTKGRDVSSHVDVTICNKIINRVSYVKFLGVTIDSTLSWSQHVRITKTKIAKGIGMLVKAKKFLCKSTLIAIYNSFLYPHLLYGIEVWGRASRCYIDSLFKMQKRQSGLLHLQI